jgi:hypothetical protein
VKLRGLSERNNASNNSFNRSSKSAAFIRETWLYQRFSRQVNLGVRQKYKEYNSSEAVLVKYDRSTALLHSLGILMTGQIYMAGRPRSSPIHRDKSIICSDLAIVLGQACAKLSDGAKYAVIDQALQLWSAHDGKYEGCRYWTKEALFAKREHLRYNGQGLTIPHEHRLIHEHIVPRKIIRDLLLTSSAPTATQIESLLDLYCVGAIITRPQDDQLTQAGLRDSMPHGWRPGGDMWARHRACGIQIVDRLDNDKPIY